MGGLVIGRADGRPLWRVTVAGSWLARLRGLMGRRELAADEGLFLPGTNGIHMFFMRFPIDCVFVGDGDADGTRRVIAIHPDLAPWRGIVPWVGGARGALELPAGSARQAGLAPGDALHFGP